MSSTENGEDREKNQKEESSNQSKKENLDSKNELSLRVLWDSNNGHIFVNQICFNLQIKTTKWYHCIPIIRAKIKIVTTANAGQDAEKLNHLDIAGGNEKQRSHFEKQFGGFLKTEHPTAILPRNCNAGHLCWTHEDLCWNKNLKWIFTEALFLIAPNWKQP